MKQLVGVLALMLVWFALPGNAENKTQFLPAAYTAEIILNQPDTVPPPIKDRHGDYVTDPNKNPFDLKDPNVVEKDITYDPETGLYIVSEKIGDQYFRPPIYMTLTEYYEYKRKQENLAYFQRLSGVTGGVRSSSGKPDPVAKIDVTKNLIDRLFGGSDVEIKPQGYIALTFGGDYQYVQNPIWTQRQQRTGGFDFDMDPNLSASGKIGEKLSIDFNFNPNANFDFDQQMKLAFDSDQFSEDDIIKKIEAGNVNLPLQNSLIQGSQDLFGLKTELQFGRLRLTALASQQRSQAQSLQLQGGSRLLDFEVLADQYDENRHFFLSHFNRDQFEATLSNLPQISSLFTITRMEVWITNDRFETQNVRDVVAIADIGEYNRMTNNNPDQWRMGVIPPRDIYGVAPLPDNSSNSIYQAIINDPMARNLDNAVATLQSLPFDLEQVRDFEKVRARLLSPSEYTYHPQLGFISLNINLRQDQVLSVSYEYVYKGKTFHVGELSNDSPNNPDTLSVLYTKLLKSTSSRIDLPIWDLMMKNFYNIGAYQIDQEDFRLDVFYDDPGAGLKRFLPATNIASIPLINLFNLDNLNPFSDPQPDGVFDFVPGLTIYPQNGRIMFPVLEPFGTSLANRMNNNADSVKYTFQQLYDSTVTKAREFPELNRFVIKGEYKSSGGGGSDVALGGFGIPKGSVKVRAGSQILQEGVDYTVDYNSGRVNIINESIKNSGAPIDISYEDKNLFGLQNRSMMGLRAEYEFRNSLTLGATTLKLFERPYTQKVNVGEDPINNSVYGLDLNFSNQAPWLTKAVDALPFYSTKAPSKFSIQAEMAALNPGHSRAINLGDDKGGVTYLDDFEGSTSSIDLRVPYNGWVMASVPRDGKNAIEQKFPEANFIDSTINGVNRAKLSWYRIDPSADRGGCDAQDPYVAQVNRTDIFRGYQRNRPGLQDYFATFDLTYYPNERGPYNFELPEGTEFSEGLNKDGTLKDPSSRWAGIMRSLYSTDFEQTNVEYIEFWMLNPFMDKCDGTPTSKGGKLYIDLGNVSEDILQDSRKFFENGLPRPGSTIKTDTTSWSRIPRVQPIVNAFDNDPEVRALQDVGLDGFNDQGERSNFDWYLDRVGSFLEPAVFQRWSQDPANDNFLFWDEYPENTSLIQRYKNWNNPQANSRPTEQGQRRQQSYTNIPDSEDLNRDNTMNESESYYRYEIPIENDGSGGLAINEFITDTVNSVRSGTWYRFKIPVEQFSQNVGGIQGFRSIRFIRLLLKEFDERITFRFGTFELVRNQWRRYQQSLCELGSPNSAGSLDLNEINIEEHGTRAPFPYVIPKGIEREQDLGPYPNLFQNEQSLALNVCNLVDGCSRAIYKNVYTDIRNYERIKMFVHAESEDDLDYGEMQMFIRLGSDYINNYYEYIIPLQMSQFPYDATKAAEAVWREENEFDVALNDFVELKKKRNREGASIILPFEDTAKYDQVIRVVGNPNLGQVKTMMIGLYNPDGGRSELCAEVWINELRVTGLNEQGGVAGQARMDFQLADLGNLSLSGNFSTIGWGAIDQRVDLRSQETLTEYNITSSINLDKFLGENTSLRLPFFIQHSNLQSSPKYDPYDLDVKLKDKLRNAETQTARDSIRDQAIEKNKITSINFSNVRKVRNNNQKKPKPWDIENFSATYAYSKAENQNPIIAKDEVQNHRGELEYAYSRRAKYIQPFKNLSKSNWLKFITELNINPIPNNFSVNNTVTRVFGEKKYRFSEPIYSTWFNKRFSWDRSYVLQWDLTKSLKMNFNAETNAVIDEPDEYVDRFTGQRLTKSARRDSIWSNIKNFGRNKNYIHNINLNYNVPTKNFPLLDWITLRGQVSAQYSWSARALNVDSLGNILQNSQTRNATATLNFESLYNKSKYLSKINGKQTRRAPTTRRTTQNQRTSTQDDKKEEKKDREPSIFEKVLIRPLMLIRTGQFTYQENISSVVPGFTPQTRFLGMNKGFEAPGWNYVLGMSPTDQWLDQTASKGWISASPFLNDEFIRNSTKRFDARVTMEPFPDFRIDLNLNSNFVENHSEFFRNCDQPNAPIFEHQVPRDVGTYSVSYLGLKTLFNNDLDQLIERFMSFEDMRTVVSQRIGSGSHSKDGEEYAFGYGRYQSDVMVPAFVAAYTGLDPNQVELDVFKINPRPNWELSYNGLNKLPFFRDVIASFNLTHNYQSNLTVSSYNTDIDYHFQDPFNPNNINPLTQNYYSRFEIPNVVITENFSPLIGADLKTRNNMSIRFDMAKSRNLALNLTDYQLIEANSEQLTFGFGYTLSNVNIGFLTGNKKRKTSRTRSSDNAGQGQAKAVKGNDLNIAFTYSVRDDITINHVLDQGQNEPTRGLKSIGISPSIDYQATNSLNLRLFVDYRKTEPYTSSAYPITSIRGGLTVKLSLE